MVPQKDGIRRCVRSAGPTITMKFQDLLYRRDELIREARLANVAYAYQWIGDFAARIAQSGLRGEVTLLGPNPEEERLQPILRAENFSQSVIEEHFLNEEIAELAAVLAFAYGAGMVAEVRFKLEDVGPHVLPRLRLELEASGVQLEEPASSMGESGQQAA